eukprot:COSAG02_NODE_68252_length_251_cov_0.657895_2_plen_60_part_01
MKMNWLTSNWSGSSILAFQYELYLGAYFSAGFSKCCCFLLAKSQKLLFCEIAYPTLRRSV